MAGPKAVAQADQHCYQHSAGHQAPCCACSTGTVSAIGLISSSFPRQDSQPDRGSHHRVDEQNHQHGVNQSEPVVAGELLQCLGISQKNATLNPGLRIVGCELQIWIRPFWSSTPPPAVR